MLNLICPKCKSRLIEANQGLECQGCKQRYPVINNIPSVIDPTKHNFYQNYYQTELGLRVAEGHLRPKNPFFNILLEARNQVSLVGTRQRFFKKAFKKERDCLILDLGCGGGYELFSKYGKVVGVDMELTPLKTAQLIYSAVIHADIISLPFENNVFDYVVTSDVIGHIPNENKDAFLSEIYRVLKKNGKTVNFIETDSDNLLFRFAHKYPDLFQKNFIEETGHFGLEMPKATLNRFHKHGFKLVKAEKIGGLIWPIEEYIYWFNNAYKNKSKAVKILVFLCGILNKNIITREISNILLRLPNYLSNQISPLNSGVGLLVIYKK